MGCANTKQIMENTTEDLVEKYAKAVGMDRANKEILSVVAKDGWDVGVEKMLESADNDYLTMRMKYG